MSPAELVGHGRRKLHQVSDSLFAERRLGRVHELPEGGQFPMSPKPGAVPAGLQAALRRDAADILNGRWIAFGWLPLQVDDPPRWHNDYLADVDLPSQQPALKLHHRLEGKADIKLIWEPSRWYSIVRLAQAAYVLGDVGAARHCVRLLQDWCQVNPAYYGWHWTSALETGLRLTQFAWIDALLSSCGADSGSLPALRAKVLPAHLWFTWRNRSFGSSANNHLIGELSGLLVALCRWPGLEKWAAPISTLQRLWEREVLAQFAPDGGNREQALNYHLFSWEFCWQARLALRASGRSVSATVDDRLRAAVNFFTAVQSPTQPWDYGDSDSAFVTPFFDEWPEATCEWYTWFQDPTRSPSIQFWLGQPPKAFALPEVSIAATHWRTYPDSGFAVCRKSGWFLRWDLSPLGYLTTAGHGHCDALHLSIWYHDQALVIDPGTGAYHADRPLRDYLASWQAHNGLHPVDPTFPERRGAFLWSVRHEQPSWREQSSASLGGELRVPDGLVRRTIARLEAEDGWQIDDAFEFADVARAREIEVYWQFAPAVRLERANEKSFLLHLGTTTFSLEFLGWEQVESLCPAPGQVLEPGRTSPGVCSPAFRKTQLAPYVLLRGRSEPAVLRSVFRRTG
jgi:hypothetical protein